MAGATHCPQLHCEPAQFQLPICATISHTAANLQRLKVAAAGDGDGGHLGSTFGSGAAELAFALGQVWHPGGALLQEPGRATE